MGDDRLGKKAEQKIKEWLNRPEQGYCFDRIPDQLTGMWGSKNICDFILYKKPYMYYLESKATWSPLFSFSAITDYQNQKLQEKSKIDGVFGLVIVLYATYKRAFILDINDIQRRIDSGKKSININKIDKWNLPYAEIKTLQSRKTLLDYTGEIEEYISELQQRQAALK